MKQELLEIVDREHAQDLGVDFRVGDTIKVYYKVKEGEKERVQLFQGVVISKTSRNFTVRKVSLGVGIERIIPRNSPFISKVEIVSRGRVRRAKLFYLRDKVGKAARIKEAKA